MKWGHAAAHRLKRILVDAEWAHQCHSDCVGEVVGPREVCQTFDEAPNLPMVGTPIVPSFAGKARVAILSLGDVIALHAMGPYSKYSLLAPAYLDYPLEVWGASSPSRISVFARSRAIQMEAGGVWRTKVRADFRTRRHIRLQFQRKGAYPWPPERRNGSRHLQAVRGR